MTLLFGHEETVAEWVGRQIGKPFHPPFAAFGVLGPDGTLTGGCVFTGHTGDAIELSLAGRGAMMRGTWAAVMHYVFVQSKCSRLQVHTMANNKRMRQQLPRIGFVFEGKSRRLFGAVDGLCYSLTTDDLPAFRARWGLA